MIPPEPGPDPTPDPDPDPDPDPEPTPTKGTLTIKWGTAATPNTAHWSSNAELYMGTTPSGENYIGSISGRPSAEGTIATFSNLEFNAYVLNIKGTTNLSGYYLAGYEGESTNINITTGNFQSSYYAYVPISLPSTNPNRTLILYRS